MTPTSTDEAAALERIRDPDGPRAFADLVAAMRAMRRTAGHTARGALVLAFVAPLVLRKPAHSGHPPEGWTKILVTNHLLGDMVNGVWWTPTELVPGMASGRGFLARNVQPSDA